MSNPFLQSIFGSISGRTIARIVVVICTVVLLIAFNASLKSDRGPLQNDFDAWLQSTKQAISQSIETAPQVTVALFSERPEFKADWKISLGAGGDPERLVRILDLAKEANIFSRSSTREVQPVRVTVSDGTREFVAALSPNDIITNVEAANLIKLFQLYAVELPSTVAKRAVADGATEVVQADTAEPHKENER